MKYFIDTEYWERSSAYPGAAGAIDLISIGIVAEDGREFYAENSHFPWSVVASHAKQDVKGTPAWLTANIYPHLLGGDAIKHPHAIRSAILDFISIRDNGDTLVDSRPEFWSYYCDYDWVIFCWIFGCMIDLPSHFPMYCHDLKQEMDRLGIKRVDLPPGDERHNALDDARWVREAYKGLDRA